MLHCRLLLCRTCRGTASAPAARPPAGALPAAAPSCFRRRRRHSRRRWRLRRKQPRPRAPWCLRGARRAQHPELAPDRPAMPAATSTAVRTRTAGAFLTNLLTNPLWGTACRWPRQGGAPLPRRASGVAFAPHSACRWTDQCSSAANAAGRRPRPGGGLSPRRGSGNAVTAADISISA